MINRRAHPRFELEQVSLREQTAGARVNLEDVSRGGVRFLAVQPYAAQTRVTFHWEEGQTEGIVLSCAPRTDGELGFSVRAVFEEPLPLPVVGLLLVQAELGTVTSTITA